MLSHDVSDSWRLAESEVVGQMMTISVTPKQQEQRRSRQQHQWRETGKGRNDLAMESDTDWQVQNT